MSVLRVLRVISLILGKSILVLSRTEDDKFVGFDKSNQTTGYHNYFPHSKESSEKILKGIWLVLGMFLIVALFLLCRFLYKASSVLCLHRKGYRKGHLNPSLQNQYQLGPRVHYQMPRKVVRNLSHIDKGS